MCSDAVRQRSPLTACLSTRVLQEETKAFLEMAGRKLWTTEQGIKDNVENDSDDDDSKGPAKN